MLQPTRKIPPAEWMSYPETKMVMEALNRFEDEPAALFVGGCVRNTLFDLPVDDIDIATRLAPDEVTRRLENAGMKVVPTGIDHGTVTAVLNKKSFEITTLRKDVQTDGRHAKVEFTDDWTEDAKRRDFTINTLLADIEGHIYDVLGMGLGDISRQTILFVGEPEERIQEDYLRILRFFRFHAIYGREEPNAEALAACKEYAPFLDKLSKERVTQEYCKIIDSENPAPILTHMKSCKILTDLMHSQFNPMLMQEFCELQRRYEHFNLMARFVILGCADKTYLDRIEKRLVFSNKQKQAYSKILEVFGILNKMSETQLKIMLYKSDKDTVTQAAMIHKTLGRIDKDYLEFIMHLVERWEVPSLPVSGKDVQEMGIEEGPKVGTILDQIEAWWLDEAFKPDRGSCMDKLEAIIKV